MKLFTLFFVLILFSSCQNNINEPTYEEFNCTGVWANHKSLGQGFLQLFILQKSSTEFEGELYNDFNFIGSFNNGKIIGKERYISFSYEQETPFGKSSMGFQGRFYQTDQLELRGLLSGRIYLPVGILFIFDKEQEKFTQAPMSYAPNIY